jgi:hypothetical protein
MTPIEMVAYITRLRPPCRTHFSFITKKNKVIAMGAENRGKTHPKLHSLGYPYPTIHSEFDAYRRVRKADRSELTLYNIRVSSNGTIGMSKPCKYCLPWVIDAFKHIYYTNERGELLKYV